ncbi:MAG: hypothetical protein ACE5EU_04855 [Paracoccaceae bacterium]
MADNDDAPNGAAESAPEHTLDETPSTPGRDVGVPTVPDATYDPSEDREQKRGQIALMLVWLLVGIVIGGFAIVIGKAVCVGVGGTTMCDSLKVADVRPLIEMLLTPIVGLVGAVTGFYFGEKKS